MKISADFVRLRDETLSCCETETSAQLSSSFKNSKQKTVKRCQFSKVLRKASSGLKNSKVGHILIQLSMSKVHLLFTLKACKLSCQVWVHQKKVCVIDVKQKLHKMVQKLDFERAKKRPKMNKNAKFSNNSSKMKAK